MKYWIFPFLFFFIFSPISSVSAEDCHFQYWEVIPFEKCQVYYLPDFTFRSFPPQNEAAEVLNRFCSKYEITSKFGKQQTAYCYTGEGDRMGPTFKLGDEGWQTRDTKGENVFFADLNFSGCNKGKKSTGIVFGPRGWIDAPKRIQRSWPLLNQLAECE